MSGPVFDSKHDPLGDLTLKMTEELEPDLDIDNIQPDVESVEETIKATETTPVNEIFVKRTPMVNDLETITEIGPQSVGDRGVDKKKRKKRTMTPASLEKLAAARAKSLATRRAKAAEKKAAAEEVRVTRALKKRQATQDRKDALALAEYEKTKNGIPVNAVVVENVKLQVKNKPPANVFDDFDKFCNYMDRYDERKRKNHTTSKQPHPNQKIPERQRPRPPVQNTQRNPQFRTNRPTKQPDDFSPYSLLKSGRSSVFGRSGMNGNNNTGW